MTRPRGRPRKFNDQYHIGVREATRSWRIRKLGRLGRMSQEILACHELLNVCPYKNSDGNCEEARLCGKSIGHGESLDTYDRCVRDRADYKNCLVFITHVVDEPLGRIMAVENI